MNSSTEYSESDAIVIKNLIKVRKCIGIKANILISKVSVTIIKSGLFDILSALKTLKGVFVYMTTLFMFTHSNM